MNKYKWLAIIISTVVLIVSSSPIIYFSIHPNSGLKFLGRHFINSQDVYTYVSFIEQAKGGRNLFENLYTTEPQKPSLIRPSYVVIGKIAALTNTTSIVAYHSARIIFGVLFLFVLYKFVGFFFKDEKTRFISYTLILTSSGLGFLLFKWIPNSIDLWIPEANTFLSLSEAPHFILSQMLELLGFMAFLTYLKNKNAWLILVSFLSFLLLSFEHPFNLIVIVPVIILTGILTKTSWKTWLTFSIAPTIGLIFQYYLTSTNPTLALWQSQNILTSPPPVSFISGYGLLLILMIVTAENLLNADKINSYYKFALVWVAATGLLIYAPISFQRRLIEGVHIPIVLLATYGLVVIFRKHKLKYQTLIIAGIIAILAGTSFFSIYNDFTVIGNDKSDNYYYHIAPEEEKAIAWLGSKTKPDDTILSSWYIGNIIPGMIGRKVYLGHKIQTVDWDAKNRELDDFVLNGNPTKSDKFLRDNGIKYMFLGKNDVLLQNGFNAKYHTDLKLVYNEGEVSIYQVLGN